LASIAGVRDVQDLLSGKWKFAIIAGLNYERGKMRFMDLLRHIDGIAPKYVKKN
jgi:DNA-binding HxlR family transcriptional regulator